MKEIGLYDAKTKLSALVAELEAGGEVIALTRHGRIVAELHPHHPVLAPKRGCLKSAEFFVAPDFDDSETGFEDFFEEVSPGTRVAEEVPAYKAKKKP